MPRRTRRALLRTLGASALAGLAGCSDRRQREPETAPGTSPPTRPDSPSTTERTATTQTEPTATTGREPTGRLSCGPAWPTTERWPVAGGTPAGSTYAPEGERFAEAPDVAWSVRPEPADGLEEFQPEFARPVVAGDAVYVAKPTTYGVNQPRPERHFVEARDQATGSLRWSVELEREPVGPAVGTGAVHVGDGTDVAALDPSSGDVSWRRTFDDQVEAVVPARDRLLVRTDGSIHAMDPDGATRWSVPLSAQSTAGPAAVGWRCFVGLRDGTVECRDLRTGDRHWEATTLREAHRDDDSPRVDSLTATACAVYALTDGDVYAFDRDGQFHWAAGEDVWQVATDGDAVYLGTGDGVLRSVAAASGDVRWERSYSAEDHRTVDGFFTPLVLTDDALYGFARHDTLLAVSPDTGDPLWTVERRMNDLALAGGTLYGTVLDAGPLVALR